jgi:hypothetical protein
MRDFSVIRRRKNIVDVLTPKRAGVAGYRFQVATNFDQTYTTIVTAPIGSGYLDPAINPVVLQAVNNNDHIRVVFNPDTFNGVAGISDGAHFWMRFQPVDFAGTPGTAGPGTLILTDAEHYGNSRVQISGTAPSGAAVANSLQLNLPQNSQDFYIRNANATAGNALYVSFQVGGAEQQVAGQEVMKAYDGPSDTLMVRGSGGTAAFSASFTNYLPL